MPETNEGKIQMAKLTQKLDDHVSQQNSDMSELKSGIVRIETKLDVKADKDEIDKVTLAIESKADKKQLDTLDNRFWAIVMAIVVAFIGLIVTAIQVFNGKLQKGKI